MKVFKAAFLLFLLCSATTATWAQDTTVKDEPLGYKMREIKLPTKNISGIIAMRDEVTVDAFLTTVDAFHPQIGAADARRRISSARVQEVQGVFDPNFSTLNGYTWMQNTSRFATLKKVIFNQQMLELPTRSGIRLFATYRYNPLSSQSPFIETGRGGEWAGGVTMPLLRGLVINERETNEKVAKIGEPVATQFFTLSRLDILLRASLSYWNWVGAQRKLEVARRLVSLSKILIDIADKRAQKGDLPRIEVIEAEADYQRRVSDQIAIELEFQKATYDLAIFLFDDQGNPSPLLGEHNVPHNWPAPTAYSAEELNKSVELAVQRRPELKRIALQKTQAQLQLKLARNNLLPQADLTYSQGYDTGTAGIGNVFRGQLQFSQPLYVRQARGQIKSANLNIQSLVDEERAEKQRIVSEVLSAGASINASFQKYLAVSELTHKMEQVYIGERKRFNVGDSNVFLVTQRERQLFDARVQLVDTQRDYLQALARMKALTLNI